MKRRILIAATAAATVLLLGLWVAGAGDEAPTPGEAVRQAEGVLSSDLLYAHTAFLADDLLEGRGPGSRGDLLTQKYIAAQFERLGLQPGGDNGTWLQKFPIVGKNVTSKSNLTVTSAGQQQTFKFYDEFVPFSGLDKENIDVSGEMVFVGYGIVAPEYNWDDFKGMDLKGKVLFGFVNDPPATVDEPGLFGGKALTYYGRWTYKYEEAERQGAVGAILIHTTDMAGYPYQVVQTSWTGEQFELPRPSDALPPVPLQAWVTDEVAARILSAAGQDLEQLLSAAARRDFQPVKLGLTASTSMTQTVRTIDTANVVGVELKNEYVVYTSHHDHLGKGEGEGDVISNGASDNAIGIAALLGIAEAMAALPGGSKRSQIFAAVAAEEQGLLGSEHYANNPTVSAADTAANINMDGLNTWGPTRDIVLIGSGKSEMDEVAALVAERNNLELLPDQFPEKGFFYRSDQFNLAKVGVPALYFDAGLDVVGKPEGYGKQKFEEYTANDYHQPSDEIKPDWDWSGAEQMARYLFEVGWVTANWEREFHWHPTAEFRAAREESLKKKKMK
jgi:Zn-dependent M28 family amino/carboxypeptidase